MEKKMQIDQFVELAAAVVQSLPRDMDTTTGQGWITNRDALAKVLRQALMPTVAQKSEPLLAPAGAITVRPATKFIVADHFKVNTKKNAPVKISYIGDNFTAWLLDKVEDRPSASDVPPGDGPFRTPPSVQNDAALRYQTLNQRSVDGPIIAELGGEAKAEMAIAEIFALMANQVNGQQGALLTNGYANIFYVRDANGVFRVVGVGWGGGWHVYAYSVVSPREWYAGDRVFSRDS